MVTTSLQLGEVATHLTSSKLGGNLGGLTICGLLVGDGGSETCILGC